MAQSINTVSNHINGTTTAVVGMKTAVIAAEVEGTKHVCDNVNRGFYSLIRSTISQKMAKLSAQVNSQLIQLNQQRKQLMSIRTRMTHDYNMISARYLKLFTSINRNLKLRVTELDRPVIDFVERDMSAVQNRSNLLTATVPVSQIESVSDSQRIIASNVKYRGLEVIESINRFLSESLHMQQVTDQILLHERTDQAQRQVAIPVVLCESRIDEIGNNDMQIIMSTDMLSEQNRTAIRSRMQNSLDSLKWENPQTADERLSNEYAKLVSDSTLSEREKKMALQLFNNSPMATLAGEAQS
jgi:hypothetical protein